MKVLSIWTILGSLLILSGCVSGAGNAARLQRDQAYIDSEVEWLNSTGELYGSNGPPRLGGFRTGNRLNVLP